MAEESGAYWEALASYLHGLERRVSVVNPARIKAFAQSELLRTKTDEVNAALIARFCKSQSPEPWLPPPAEIRVLQALMRHYEHLKTTRAQQSVYALSPRERRSGTSIHGRARLCKTGNARVRKALYMPAMVALRFNPTPRIFAERLLAAGKHKRPIIGAVMRKLLVLAYGILRSGVAFANYA